METITVNEAFCPQNHACPVIRVCPTGAIEQHNAFSAPVINEEKCTGCGVCTNYCQTFSKN
ncbi:MAG: 4Fe-4S binding protein [Salinivirgaceae bacterium]|nr:4Fe-4S binding protein [Salinivirgaceae bacterium]